ncbi:hypothetical protein Tco_1109621 [Tanacetum coccineum]
MKNPSNRCECAVTELVEFIRAHQLVSLELILIDDSLRVFVCSVWCQFGDVRFESLILGDIKFLLVAFDSQLKVFYPFNVEIVIESSWICFTDNINMQQNIKNNILSNKVFILILFHLAPILYLGVTN